MPTPHLCVTPTAWQDRLCGVPSKHFDPVFAQQVHRAIAEFAPDCIALEIPAGALVELQWALTQWPLPTASAAQGTIFPFIPGDSIFEAARLATAQGIPLHAIDLDVAESEYDQENKTESRSGASPLPDSQWAEQLGESWNAAFEALIPPPEASDAAREAHMARLLAQLLEAGNKVLWVGGAFHWPRVLARLSQQDFQAPTVKTANPRQYERAQLAASALFAICGRTLWQINSYSAAPESYRESNVLQEAATRALNVRDIASSPVLVFDTEGNADPVFQMLHQESCNAMDAARVLLYARNLAATTGLRSTPEVSELLSSAVSIIGPRYAGRLFQLLLQEDGGPASPLPSLTYEQRDRQVGYWLENRPLAVRPYWYAAGAGKLIWSLKPKAPPPPDYLVPSTGDKQTKRSWLSHPEDRYAYREFVHHLFDIASHHASSETRSVPFVSGLGEGIDVRATLRAIDEDEIWVREPAHAPIRITNAVLDWGNETEFCPFLQDHRSENYGWIDPSEFFSFGSCSREGPEHRILKDEPLVQLDRRRWTLLTLDRGTSSPRDNGSPETQKYPPSFYDEVIGELVRMQGHELPTDNVYGWLDVMFRFCAGKPFAYISMYTPSQRIYRIATRHRVKLFHVPLSKIPRKQRARNEYFRFMTVPIEQWRRVMTHNHATWF